MIDVRLLREELDMVKRNCVRRGCKVDVDALARLDEQARALKKETEDLRAERNRLSMDCKDNPAARERVKEMKGSLAEKEAKLAAVEAELEQGMSWLPNILHSAVPDGSTDADNAALRIVGEPRKFDFKPKDHQELGESLGVLDIKRGAKVAGSGYYYWRGAGARLCSALFNWTLDEMGKRGFTQFMTPCVAKDKTLYGTGYLPFFAEQSYKIAGEDVSLIGTSEQTLVGYHADETLDAAELPLRYTALTPCFRTEAGSYGKATRGIFRVHQFWKVEQIVFCLPTDSERCHAACLQVEEDLLQSLGIPYRVVDVCVGDMGAPGTRKYDTEGHFPGFGGYRELTSNTNLTDFQARRLGIRYKDSEGNRGFVHTISATAATERLAICVMENFQDASGAVSIPEPLRPYTGFDSMRPGK